jgi:hypothetical protein
MVLGASIVEVLTWVVCFLLAIAAIGQTVPQHFPMQHVALGGESTGAGFALGLALLGVRRIELFLDPTYRALRETRGVLLGIGLRFFLGAPALVTLIVVSAAGFTA